MVTLNKFTLADYRSYVYSHMDLEEDDLPVALIDRWLAEAHARVYRARDTWPHYQTRWELITEPGVAHYDPTSDIDSGFDRIDSVRGPNGPLSWIGVDEAERRYGVISNGNPQHWATWASEIVLFPTPVAAETLTVRGYRKPKDWPASGIDDPGGSYPDIPDGLSNVLRSWVLGEAYMQQEDTELAITYLDMANDELEKFKKRIEVAEPSQPLIINKGSGPTVVGTPRFVWE